MSLSAFYFRADLQYRVAFQIWNASFSWAFYTFMTDCLLFRHPNNRVYISSKVDHQVHLLFFCTEQ